MSVLVLLVTVDRIEGPWAVVQMRDAVAFDVPLVAFPPGVREGDQFILQAQPVPPSAPRLPDGRSQGAASVGGDRADTGKAAASQRDETHASY